MFITLYCNPFFPGCKEKFLKNAYFFVKPPQRSENTHQNGEETLPKSGKKRRKPRAEALIPQKAAQKQRGGVGKTQVPAADPETQIDPEIKQRPDEEQITQPAPAQRAQEPIHDAQHTAQQESLQQIQPGIHPNKRRSRPPVRGSA